MPFQPMNFAAIPPQGNPLAKQLLPAIQQGMQTAYTPRMLEADIFSKQFSPLAQIASSPLTLAMLPNQKTQMADLISKLLDQNRGVMTQGGNQGGLGLFSNLANAIGLGGSPASGASTPYGSTGEPTGQYSGSNAPNMLPQRGGGLQGGAYARATGEYSQTPYKPGTVTENPNTGQLFSTAAEPIVAKTQQNQAAITRLTPILNDLAKGAEPFLSKGSTLKLLGSQAAGELYKAGLPKSITDIFGTPELAEKHAKFLTDQSKSIESLMTIYNLPADMESARRVEQIVTPQPGETSQGYKARMQSELSTLSAFYNQNQQIMSGGFELNGQQPSFNQGVNQAVTNNLQGNQPSAGAKLLAKDIQIPEFASQKEAIEWYKRQPKVVQDAVKMSMGNR